ncbi:MAG: pilus assembly protein N-terminal domain-containing protein [Gammaproteobacteria bacterium]
MSWSHGWLTFGALRRHVLCVARLAWRGLLLMLFSGALYAREAPIVAAPTGVLTVPAGQSLLLRYADVKRVAAGDGSIVDVKVFDDTHEILLLGKRDGVTDLRIWARDGTTIAYQVRVLAAPIEQPPPPPPLQAEPTILIKAKLIEVKKTALRDIGIDWADMAAGPVFGMLDEFVTNEHFRILPDSLTRFDDLPLELGTGNRYLAMTTVVESVVNLLVNNGDARLLAEPLLTCISGGQADFLVGGEVPIPVQNQDGALNVIFKQFGIILNVAPRASDGLIRTKVGVEVSSVDKAISVLGFPGFATRKTHTEMNVQSGETMIVAGLFNSEDAKTVVKMPGLGSLPILGEFFKSRQFRRGETELVVLVTPQILGEDDEAVRRGIQKFDELRRSSTEALKPKLLD